MAFTKTYGIIAGIDPTARRSMRPTRHPMRGPEDHPKGGSGGGTDDDDEEEPEEDDEPSEDDDDDEGDSEQKPTKKVTSDGPDWKARSRQNENALKATNKQLKQIKQLLGLGEDDKVSPEKLQEMLDERDSKLAATTRDNAILRITAKLGVDADDLTDSKRFMAKVDDLDPEDAKYTDQLKALVTKEVKERKLGKSPGSSGTKEQKGETSKGQLTRDDLKTMSPDAIVKAQKEGRLKDLMGS